MRGDDREVRGETGNYGSDVVSGPLVKAADAVTPVLLGLVKRDIGLFDQHGAALVVNRHHCRDTDTDSDAGQHVGIEMWDFRFENGLETILGNRYRAFEIGIG